MSTWFSAYWSCSARAAGRPGESLPQMGQMGGIAACRRGKIADTAPVSSAGTTNVVNARQARVRGAEAVRQRSSRALVIT